jgi:hypothetical protein
MTVQQIIPKKWFLITGHCIANELTILPSSVNQGKGSSIHTGIKNRGRRILIIQDADLEYDPEEYNEMLKPVSRER